MILYRQRLVMAELGEHLSGYGEGGMGVPNRILKESICTSDTINGMSDAEEVFFYRLLVKCDDYGRLDARPAILRAWLYPLRLERVPEAMIKRRLAALVRHGLIWLYTVGGKRYLQVVTWARHQQVRAARSKYPSPEEADPCTPAVGAAGGSFLGKEGPAPAEKQDSKPENGAADGLAAGLARQPGAENEQNPTLIALASYCYQPLAIVPVIQSESESESESETGCEYTRGCGGGAGLKTEAGIVLSTGAVDNSGWSRSGGKTGAGAVPAEGIRSGISPGEETKTLSAMGVEDVLITRAADVILIQPFAKTGNRAEAATAAVGSGLAHGGGASIAAGRHRIASPSPPSVIGAGRRAGRRLLPPVISLPHVIASSATSSVSSAKGQGICAGPDNTACLACGPPRIGKQPTLAARAMSLQPAVAGKCLTVGDDPGITSLRANTLFSWRGSLARKDRPQWRQIAPGEPSPWAPPAVVNLARSGLIQTARL